MQTLSPMPGKKKRIHYCIIRHFIMVVLAMTDFNSCSSGNTPLNAVYFSMEDHRTRAQFHSHGKNVCVMIAHQDDEFPISPTLREHLFNGDTLIFVWATRDKDMKDREKRKKEALRAVALLNVLPSNQYFLDFNEQTIHFHINELIHRYARIFERHSPALIYIPAFEGGHIDHDTVHFCAVEALSISPNPSTAYEFALYNNYNNNNLIRRLAEFSRFIPSPQPEEILTLDAGGKRFKRAYWNCYKSQMLKFNLAIYLSGDADELWTMDKVRQVPAYTYTNPPHSGKLSYERNFPFQFREFRDAVNRYRQNAFRGGDAVTGYDIENTPHVKGSAE